MAEQIESGSVLHFNETPLVELREWLTGIRNENGQPVLVVTVGNGQKFAIQIPAKTAMEIAASLKDVAEKALHPIGATLH